MQAVVLVGGFGTRLRPLTSTVPKPMLPVGHRPIIEHIVESLGRAGVTEVVLALGFKPEPFLAAFPDGTCHGVAIRYAVEPEPLGTAGAIRYAADLAGIASTFVVMNGDVLTDLDVAQLVEFHRSHGAEGTIHLTPVEDPSAFGVVTTDENGRVRAFIEKPSPGESPTNLVNAGTYVLEPSVLGRIEPHSAVSIERVVFPAMVADHTLFAMPAPGYWLDTGTPQQYLQANLDLIDGHRVTRTTVAAEHPTATVAGSALVERSMIGVGATVAAGATVRDSLLLPGASVGVGAKVVRSVVAGRVGADSTIVDVVVGAAGAVERGTSLEGVRVPEVG